MENYTKIKGKFYDRTGKKSIKEILWLWEF